MNNIIIIYIFKNEMGMSAVSKATFLDEKPSLIPAALQIKIIADLIILNVIN